TVGWKTGSGSWPRRSSPKVTLGKKRVRTPASFWPAFEDSCSITAPRAIAPGSTLPLNCGSSLSNISRSRHPPTAQNRRKEMFNKRHAALCFIFFTVMLDMLAFGVIAPILPKLITNFVGGDIARSSEYMGLFVTVWAVMQFFCSPVIGVL